MYFKKLVGKKCYLSPADLSDTALYVKWLNDLDVVNSTFQVVKCHNEASEEDFLNEAFRKQEHLYIIVDLKSDHPIGICGFMAIDHLNSLAEIGIMVGEKDFWNKGYAQEALSLLLDYGFKKLNLNNIMLEVFPENKPALACYIKLGFKKIGERRKAQRRDLAWHNMVYMDILPEDFYESQITNF